MDDLNAVYDKLKMSALNKAKDVSPFVQTVTIGPNIENRAIEMSDVRNEECRRTEKVTYPPILSVQDNAYGNKILVEAEILRREEVRKAVESRADLIMKDANRRQKEGHTHWQNVRKNISERNMRHENELEKELRTFEEIQAKVETERTQEFLRLQEQRRIENARKIQEFQENQRIKYVNSLQTFCRTFRLHHEKIREMTNFIESHKEGFTDVHVNHPDEITLWAARIDEIFVQSKDGPVDPAKFQAAADLLRKVAEVTNRLHKEIQSFQSRTSVENILKEELKNTPPKTQVSPRISSQPKAEIVEPDSSVNSTNSLHGKNDFVSDSSFQSYKTLEDFLKNYEASYKNLLNDENLKKYKFDCQKAINMPINAITAVNGNHLTDKFNRLSMLLSGRAVEVGHTQVSTAQHPEALAYCTDLLAKKFVRQGDLMVSSNPKSAFAFAAVIVALWNTFPDFGKLVLAHFYRECIYLVPMYVPCTTEVSSEEYYRCLGYRYTNHEVEEQDKFLKRMSGTVTLYAAVIVTKQRRCHNTVPHPHGLRFGWRWLSCILNLEPRPDITATALYSFLEVAANAMLTVYGNQFKKVLRFICKDYFPRLKKLDTGGPVVRLQVFLQDILENGSVPRPEGILPDNFW